MKHFIVWLIAIVVLFTGLGVLTHVLMTADPVRIAVAFDDSYYMKDAWPGIALKLEPLANRKYAEFFVVSNKEKISKQWERKLDINWFSQARLFLDEYDLADLMNTSKYPELAKADTIYVFSTKDEIQTLANKGNVVYVKL